jgi:hypothetical protein
MPTNLFEDCVAFFNGDFKRDRKELIETFVQNGGIIKTGLSKQVTFFEIKFLMCP